MFKALSVICSLVVVLASSQASASVVTEAALPGEVSSLLQSEPFAVAIKAQKMKAAREGSELRIVKFDVLKMAPEAYVSVSLATRQIGTTDWQSAGQLVGVVEYSQTGEAVVTSIFFKPDAEGPGGASVGN